MFFWGEIFIFFFLFLDLYFFIFTISKIRTKLVIFYQKITLKKDLLLWISYSIVAVIHRFLKFYSFKWNVLDVDSYSNAIYNGSYFLNFNSFLQIPALADHFIPSLSLFSPLYLIYPPVHWITITKTFSYLATLVLVYFWIRDKIENKNENFGFVSFSGKNYYSSMNLQLIVIILNFYLHH